MLETDLKNNTESGYVLVYVLIAMMVISILAMPFLHTLKIQAVQDEQSRRFGDIATIEAALNRYVLANGHYPAPANPRLTMDDPDYGRPVPVGATQFSLNCAPTAIVENVVCVDGFRDTTNAIEDNYDAATGTITNTVGGVDKVLIGVVPVTALGLNPDQGLDEYGHQMTYAVSKFMTQTDKASFRDDMGVIRLVNETGVDHGWLVPAGSLHYMVINHGRDGAGAYLSGNQIPCPPVAERPLENENCDGDATFLALRALQMQTIVDPVTGEERYPTVTVASQIGEQVNRIQDSNGYDINYYDDGIARLYNRSAFTSIWSQVSGADVYLTRERSTGYVAFDANFPANTYPAAQVHVSGNMRADEVMTKRICSENRAFCFGLADLSNTDLLAASRCSPTRGLKKLNFGNEYNNAHLNGFLSAQCDGITTVRAGTFPTECPNGAKGLGAGGELICI